MLSIYVSKLTIYVSKLFSTQRGAGSPLEFHTALGLRGKREQQAEQNSVTRGPWGCVTLRLTRVAVVTLWPDSILSLLLRAWPSAEAVGWRSNATDTLTKVQCPEERTHGAIHPEFGTLSWSPGNLLCLPFSPRGFFYLLFFLIRAPGTKSHLSFFNSPILSQILLEKSQNLSL